MKPGRHICTVCNEIYEEPKEHLDPNKKPFESLAENWKCPSCEAGKDKYQPCSCVTLETERKHEQHCDMQTKKK